MGEYANYALASAMRAGMPYRPHSGQNGPQHPCPICGDGKRGGQYGMIQHLRMKHGISHKDAPAMALEAIRG